MTSKSRTTTSRRDVPPVHPGEILADIISENGLSAYRVATDIGVTIPRVNDVVLCQRGVTADLALRLGKYFGQTPEFWMNLQAKYDLDVAIEQIEDELATVPKFDAKTAAEKVVRPRTAERARNRQGTRRRLKRA